MIEDDNTATPAPTKAELLAVEIGDWAPLGGDVRLELAGRRTVLVGRNGSGKSALLEGIWWGGQRSDSIESSLGRRAKKKAKGGDSAAPRHARFEFRDLKGEPLFYEFRMGEHRSWRPNSGDAQAASDDLLEECLIDILGSHRILAGIPRQTAFRGKQLVAMPQPNGLGQFLNRDEPRIGNLAEQMVTRYYKYGDGKEAVAEVEELGRRIGAWETLRIDAYKRLDDPDLLASVLVDGVDLGLLADGTLRIVEILWALVYNARLGYRLLLLEEPETGVHPGLLAGLLDTIDAYSIDRQVIVSTHSPQVVSWAKPQELRVVTREAGKTQVRPLSEQQVAQFLKYLHDQTLGEFVYSGALDDEG